MHPSVAAAAERAGQAPEVFAADAGEDYELLVTLPREFDGAADFERDTGLPLTRVGTVTDGRGVRATLGGVVQAVRGFEHKL